MTTTTDARLAALDAALAKVDKQFGPGSAFLLGKQEKKKIEAISTRSLNLDICLGIGGIPKGRIVEIYGPESSGKTTLTLHQVASVQQAGGIAVFIDAEHALDPEYAKALGVDIDALVISQPDNGEQALEIADTFIRSGAVDLVVVDSVAALVPKAEIEGEMGDSHVGLQARMMSQALRKITGAAHNSNTTVIFINQLREKIGGMSYGSNEVTTGGKALKFYASVRLDIRRIGPVKDGENVIGNQTKVKVAKNKVAPPFKVALFDIIYGEGISRENEILDLGVDTKIVQKAGAWYKDYTTGDQIGQGKEKARQFLKDNPEYANELELKIKRAMGFDPNGEFVEEDEVIPSDDEIVAAVAAEVAAEQIGTQVPAA